MSVAGYTVDLSVTDGWWSLLLLAAVTILAYRAYRPSHTRKGPHAALFLLRLSVLLLMTGLFVTPRLRVSASGVRLPLLAILVDDSESMRILSGDQPRHAVVSNLLGEGLEDRVSGRARIRTFRFSETLTEDSVPDSLLWRGSATDIASSLGLLSSRLQGEGLSGVVLISDGAHNLGQSPVEIAEAFESPIYTVPVGAEHPPRDVALTAVSHPSLGYADQNIQLKAFIEVVGIDRVDHLIRVYDGEEVVAAVPLVLSTGEEEVNIGLRLSQAGQRSLRIQIPGLEGEVEQQNNEILSIVEVLASRARVLLTGTPSLDFAYLRRVVEADSNVSVETVYPDTPQGWAFRGRANLLNVSRYDLVILHDFPGAILTPEIEAGLEGAVRAGASLLVVGGQEALMPGWAGSRMRALLPARADKPYVAGITMPRIPKGGPLHPVLRIADDIVSVREAWESLPPFVGRNRIRLKGSGARLLLESGEGEPLATLRNLGRGKVAVVAARGHARQALMMWGIGDSDRVTRSFWERLTQWLLTKEEIQKLRVFTDRLTYRSGEPITFRAEYFDDLLEPVDGAEMILDVIGEPSRTAILPGRGNGIYSGRLQGLKQGRYAYRVTARSEGGVFATAAGDLTVGRYSVEFENPLSNTGLLEELSRRSGGRTIAADALPAFLDSMKLSPQPHDSVYRLNLWGPAWPLVFLICALAGEWFVRRRRGMV